MDNSMANLCPRGFGRSSYHLAEVIQMGRVPIHIYDDGDIPWLPYERLFRRDIGFATTLSGLPALLRRLERNHSNPDELARRERAISRLRATHFTFEGAMDQIAKFMLAPHLADLQCRRLPSTVRGSSHAH